MKAFFDRLKRLAADARDRLKDSRIPGRYAFLVFGIAIAFFVQLYNSYGLASGGEEGSTRLLQSFLAPWVPHKAAPRDAITVVVYDQASFDELRIDVPILPYARQAQLIERVAAMKPVAIFIDANYKRDLSDPEGIRTFHAAIVRVRDAGIPVYIGEVKPKRAPASVASDADFFADTPAVPVKSPFDAFRDYAKTTAGFETGTLRSVDHSLDYPAATLRLYPDAQRDGRIETPAFRLYGDICNPDLANADHSIARAQLRCDALPAERPDLAIQWLSYDAATGYGDDSNPACRRSAFGTFAADVARSAFRKPAREAGYVYNPCVYLRTVKLNTVLGAPDIDVLRPEFQGKVVMIGSSLGDDSFVAPGQGKVPGVFLHAMALENLLTFGKAYHRWPPEVHMLGGSINIDFFLELALALLANVAARNVERRFAEKETPGAADRSAEDAARASLRVYFLAALGLSVLFGGLAMLITYFGLHWTPVNALSITLAAVAVAGLEKYQELMVVARKWSLAGILAVLVTGALVAWLVLSLFITNDVIDPKRTDHGMIWASGLVLLAWVAGLIVAYRRACLAGLRTIGAMFKYTSWR